jgi:hypothetical protein
MEKVEFSTKNYYVTVFSIQPREINISCNKIRGSRTYDLPKPVKSVGYDNNFGEYIMVYLEDNSYIQLKLESENEIVLDHFDEDDELITEIGAWDFFDE